MNATFEQALIDRRFPDGYDPHLNILIDSINKTKDLDIKFTLLSSRWDEYFSPLSTPLIQEVMDDPLDLVTAREPDVLTEDEILDIEHACELAYEEIAIEHVKIGKESKRKMKRFFKGLWRKMKLSTNESQN